MAIELTINGCRVPAPHDLSLFDAARSVGVRVPTSCVTQGKCKECVVEITRGRDLLSAPTEAERHLGGAFRLSCQARIAGGDGEIECHTMRRGRMRIERHAVNLPVTHQAVPLDPAVTRNGDRILIDGREVAGAENGGRGPLIRFGFLSNAGGAGNAATRSRRMQWVSFGERCLRCWCAVHFSAQSPFTGKDFQASPFA